MIPASDHKSYRPDRLRELAVEWEAMLELIIPELI